MAQSCLVVDCLRRTRGTRNTRQPEASRLTRKRDTYIYDKMRAARKVTYENLSGQIVIRGGVRNRLLKRVTE